VSVPLLMILILAGMLALVFRRRNLALLLLGLTAACAIVIGTGVMPSLVIDRLQSQTFAENINWKSRNGIILLGAGTIKSPRDGHVFTYYLGYSRVYEAARNYFNCKKSSNYCRIITSGGDPSRNGISEADVMANELKQIGVPESDILTETKSKNTFQNAQFSTPIVHQQGFDLIVLVTSGMHISRSLLYFSHFLNVPIAAPSDHASVSFSLIPSSLNFAMFDLGLHEYAGIWRYYIYNFLGWNPKPKGSV
jgi:uncharacterized SAM-binding protein YcdF (DUF218 family)